MNHTIRSFFILSLLTLAYPPLLADSQPSLHAKILPVHIDTSCNQSAGVNTQAVLAYITMIQRNLKQNNIKAIAQIITYALRWNHNKRSYTTIYNKQQFIKNYKKILPLQKRQSIIHSPLNGLFCNYQGAMIANGLLWFSSVNQNPTHITLKTINYE